MPAKLLTLPLELFETILSYLDSPCILNVCLACKELSDIAIPLLYRWPQFYVQLSCGEAFEIEKRSYFHNTLLRQHLDSVNTAHRTIERFLRIVTESPRLLHLIQYIQLAGVHSSHCTFADVQFGSSSYDRYKVVNIEFSHCNIHPSYQAVFENLIDISDLKAKFDPRISHDGKIRAYISNPISVGHDRLDTIIQHSTSRSGTVETIKIRGWNSEVCHFLQPQGSQTPVYTSVRTLDLDRFQDDSLRNLETLLVTIPMIEKLQLRYSHSRYGKAANQLDGWNVRFIKLLQKNSPRLQKIQISTHWGFSLAAVRPYGSIPSDFSGFKHVTDLELIPELLLNLNEDGDSTPEISKLLPATIRKFTVCHDIKKPYTSQKGLLNTVRALNTLWVERKLPALSEVHFKLRVDTEIWEFPYLERESPEDTLVFRPMAYVLRQVRQMIKPGIKLSITYFSPTRFGGRPGTSRTVPPVSEQRGRLVKCRSFELHTFIYPEHDQHGE
jgi:hypothetical protein